MKPYKYAFLAAAAACGLAQAADTAYTTPVGYTTTPLLANSFNLIGLNVQKSIAVAGDLEDVVGGVLTDSDVADFATVLPAGRTYIIEITSGTGLGTSQDFVTVSGSTMTLPSAVAGVAIGDTYQVRVASTLEEIFGTTTSVLVKGLTAGGTTDVVWVPNGSGGYNRYFLNNSSTFRNAVGGAAAPNVPVVYMDGLLVEKKAVANSLVTSGEVKTVGTTTIALTGFNPIGTVYPAGATLQNIGLEDDVQKGLTAGGTTDVVWIPNGTGGYNRYFLNNSSSWRNAVGGAAAPADLPLTSGIYLERKGASIPLDLTAPTSYSSL